MILNAISIVGSIASVVALWLTWLVYQRMDRLEQHYKRVGLMPGYLTKLRRIPQRLKQAQKNRDMIEAKEALATCAAILDGIARILGDEHVVPSRELSSRLQSACKLTDSDLELFCDQLVIEITGEHVRLSFLSDESRWRRPDGN